MTTDYERQEGNKKKQPQPFYECTHENEQKSNGTTMPSKTRKIANEQRQ